MDIRISPFGITEVQYEQRIHALEDLLAQVGAQTTFEVVVSRSVLLELISFRLAHATVAWEFEVGEAWDARPVKIEAIEKPS